MHFEGMHMASQPGCLTCRQARSYECQLKVSGTTWLECIPIASAGPDLLGRLAAQHEQKREQHGDAMGYASAQQLSCNWRCRLQVEPVVLMR